MPGQTPLHIAIRHERFGHRHKPHTSAFLRIIQCLLENDASLRFTNRAGKTPLALARDSGSPKEIIDILKQREKEIEQQSFVTFRFNGPLISAADFRCRNRIPR